MKIIDSQGRLFGKINIIDFLVVAVIILLIVSGIRLIPKPKRYDKYYVKYQICGFEARCDYKLPYFLVDAVNEGDAVQILRSPDGVIKEVFFQKIGEDLFVGGTYIGYAIIELPLNKRRYYKKYLKVGTNIELKTDKYDLYGRVIDFSEEGVSLSEEYSRVIEYFSKTIDLSKWEGRHLSATNLCSLSQQDCPDIVPDSRQVPKIDFDLIDIVAKNQSIGVKMYSAIVEFTTSDQIKNAIAPGHEILDNDNKRIGVIHDVYFEGNSGYVLIDIESEDYIRIGERIEIKTEKYVVSGKVFDISREQLERYFTEELYAYDIILEFRSSPQLKNALVIGDEITDKEGTVVGSIKDVYFDNGKGFVLASIESEDYIRVGEKREIKTNDYVIRGNVFDLSRTKLDLGVRERIYDFVFDVKVPCHLINSIKTGDRIIDVNGPMGMVKDSFFVKQKDKCEGYLLIELSKLEQKYIEDYITVGDKLKLSTQIYSLSGTVSDLKGRREGLGVEEDQKDIMIRLRTSDDLILSKIDAGDAMEKDRRAIATINRVVSNKALEKALTYQGKYMVSTHPFERELILHTTINTQTFRDKTYFNDQVVDFNSKLEFNFGDYVIKGEVVEIN